MSHQDNTQLKVDSILINHERVNELGTIFNSEVINKHQKNIQFALELAFYTLFGSFIFIMIALPNTVEGVRLLFPNTNLQDPIGTMLWIKMALFLVSLLPLFFGLHLSSKRLKGRLFLRRKANLID